MRLTHVSLALASTLTARFGAIARPLPYGRGSDQRRDRKGALAAGNSTISRGQRPSLLPAFSQTHTLDTEKNAALIDTAAREGVELPVTRT